MALCRSGLNLASADASRYTFSTCFRGNDGRPVVGRNNSGGSVPREVHVRADLDSALELGVGLQHHHQYSS